MRNGKELELFSTWKEKKNWDNSNADRTFVLHESNPCLIPEQNWSDITYAKFLIS